MLRVLVVDDSHFTQSQVASYLEEAGHEVVGKARNGKQAISMVEEHEPDVVTMDVKMPGMGGIEAVERIMATRPTPVVMLSRYTEEGAETTVEALEAGAVDYFHKPGEEPSLDLYEYKAELIDTVEDAAKVQPEPLAPAADTDDEEASESVSTSATASVTAADGNPLVIIASSTGGPRLLKQHLGPLPRDAGFRVIVVQHLRDQFTGQFARDLDTVSEYTVRESIDGGTVAPGEMVVAYGGSHLAVTDDDGETLTVEHVETDRDVNVQPAADVTMASAAENAEGPVIGVVLTGLGTDGTAGVEAIKTAGGRTIAQDDESSPAHWMPSSARESGYVDHVTTAADLVGTILDATRPEAEP
ncbi:chemotaxis-specific protein-glutamate methyltransferase CheB [Halorientalis salina]|uniref:chemotaxis-specific protein-glutamate methyltransferase CheB n=1 Tax=Halorientalis salina TaxID=2932266 RepID=UPI0010AD88F6|nr:chemotaxis-specific protein-glutamate methyltransferase CheB [Halorientalis salina]